MHLFLVDIFSGSIFLSNLVFIFFYTNFFFLSFFLAWLLFQLEPSWFVALVLYRLGVQFTFQ